MLDITAKEKKDFEIFLQKIETYKEKFIQCNYSQEKKIFFHLMRDFLAFLSEIKNPRIYEIFLHSKDYRLHQKIFRHYHSYYIRAVELLESIAIMTKTTAKKTDFVDLLDSIRIQDRYYRKAQELDFINFEKKKIFATVGCGSFPETMLYMYENTNIQNIIGVDDNEEAVYTAGNIVSSLGLSDVHFRCINGKFFDYKDIDIIYISNFILDKKEILQRIAETMKDDVQIITRIPISLHNIFYDTIDVCDLPLSLHITERKIYESTYMTSELLKIEKIHI
jgi:hypothetical protein